jgi:hypothetical protein
MSGIKRSLTLSLEYLLDHFPAVAVLGARQIATLKSFVSEQNLPIGLVINNAEHIEWLAPKIVQVPATFL